MLDRSLPRPRRSGVTIVEVLVALVVLSIGLLATAGTTIMAMRTASTARQERAAIQRAMNRAALLAAHGCGSSANGTSDVAGVVEAWSTTPVSRGVAVVDVRVSWGIDGSPRTFALAGAVLC